MGYLRHHPYGDFPVPLCHTILYAPLRAALTRYAEAQTPERYHAYSNVIFKMRPPDNIDADIH